IVHSLETDLTRRQFPWCADSIIIPIYGAQLSHILLLNVCSIGGLLVMLAFGRLPASLWQWDPARPRYSWAVTIVLGFLAALIAASMILDATISLPLSTPAPLLAIYLLASTRAALLAPKSVDE